MASEPELELPEIAAGDFEELRRKALLGAAVVGNMDGVASRLAGVSATVKDVMGGAAVASKLAEAFGVPSATMRAAELALGIGPAAERAREIAAAFGPSKTFIHGRAPALGALALSDETKRTLEAVKLAFGPSPEFQRALGVATAMAGQLKTPAWLQQPMTPSEVGTIAAPMTAAAETFVEEDFFPEAVPQPGALDWIGELSAGKRLLLGAELVAVLLAMAHVIETMMEGDTLPLLRAVVAYWIAVALVVALVVDERGREAD